MTTDSRQKEEIVFRQIIPDPTVQMDEDERLLVRSLIELDTDPCYEDRRKHPAWRMYKEASLSPILQRYWEPKTPAEIRHFYPNGASILGFLQWGQDLQEVISKDSAILRDLDYSHGVIGLKIKEILDMGLRECGKWWKLEKPIVVMTTFELTVQGYAGYQNCPFDGCQYAKAMCPYSGLDINNLKNLRTGEEIQGPGMIWHLIADHQFFEGGPHRVDPRQLVRVLFG